MNHVFYSSLLTVFFITATSSGSHAQLNLEKWQIGVNGGIFVYQGDLTPATFGSYKTIQPVAGLYVSRVLNPYFLLRTNLVVGKLKSDDAKYNEPVWRKERNYNFSTSVTELSELLVWNIAGNNGNELGQRFSPYMFAGVGVSLLKVNRDYSNFNAHYFEGQGNVAAGLAADTAHTLPRATLVLPVGLGVEYYLSRKLSLTVETSFRYAFSDYVDGFSQGANPKKNDFYHAHTIGLLYRFGGKNKLGCPVMRP